MLMVIGSHSEAWLALAVLVCGAGIFTNKMMQTWSHHYPKVWHDNLWPFHVAVYWNIVQVLICGRLAWLLKGALKTFNVMQFELYSILKVEHILVSLTTSGLLSAIFYVNALWLKSWFVLQGRCLLWSLSAPCQLFVTAKLHTTASARECFNAAVPAHVCMVFGLISFNEEGQPLTISRFDWQQLCYVAAVLCMLTSCKRLYSLPEEPSMRSSRRTSFFMLVVLWCSYPLVNIARSFGQLTAWQEQVLCLTALDVGSKTFFLLSMCTEPLLGLIISAGANLQFVGAVTDTSTVLDQEWVVLKDLLSVRAGTDFLNSVVSSDKQRQALLLAAQVADTQGWNVAAQKVVLSLRLENYQVLSAEVFVSRCFFGRRQMSVVLLEEAPVPDTVDASQINLNLAQQMDVHLSDSTSRALLISMWCTAAVHWGQCHLAPDAYPSVNLGDACLNWLLQMRAQHFDPSRQLQFECLSLQDQWAQTWEYLQSSSEDEKHWPTFFCAVGILSEHLRPWFGKSITIHAPEPFGDFDALGSYSIGSSDSTQSFCTPSANSL